MPVAVLVELSAGCHKRRAPDSAPFFAEGFAIVTEADGEINILDRDEVGIEAVDGIKGFAGGPEGGEGEAVFGEVGGGHHGAAQDAERPAVGEDHGSAADEVFLEFFDRDAEEVGVEAGVGIDGDDDLAGGGCEAGVADAGKIFGVFAGDDGTEVAGDLFGAVAAAVEDDDRFDFVRGEFGRLRNCG